MCSSHYNVYVLVLKTETLHFMEDHKVDTFDGAVCSHE